MELWKDILDFEGFYQMSGYSRVRSLDRLVDHSRGSGLRTVKGRILKPYLSRGRYLRINLWKLGIQSSRAVHRLVLETFVGPCPDGMECCHNDGNPANNRLDNLRWDTHQNNKLDQTRHGTSPVGERNGLANLTDKKVKIILKLLKKGKTPLSIAILFGVSQSTIYLIATNRTWKHIPRK